MQHTPTPLLTINVSCKESIEIKGHRQTVVMIPFDGTAEGGRFSGKVIGLGYDTQKITPDGKCMLSARYVLEGKDASGNACRVFIENESREDGKILPQITTDSPALGFLESETMYSEISPVQHGVIIRIFPDQKQS